MTLLSPRFAFPAAVALSLLVPTAWAEVQTTRQPLHKAAAKPAPARASRKPAVLPGPVEPPPPAEADAEQLETAGKVYVGVYECEFKQSVVIVPSPKYKGYVDVKHVKSLWLMKPVLSSTGAIRLEDVGGETLMVQITAKSMLLNVRTGQRIVDECISARQRELVEAARAAKAEAAAAAIAAPASAPEPAPAVVAPAAGGTMSRPTPIAPSASSAR